MSKLGYEPDAMRRDFQNLLEEHEELRSGYDAEAYDRHHERLSAFIDRLHQWYLNLPDKRGQAV